MFREETWSWSGGREGFESPRALSRRDSLSPEIGHGHRYVGDDRGVVLSVGAPAVEDPGLDPHQLE